MAYAEAREGGDFVLNPAQLKELHTTDLEQATELLQAAVTLGLGVRLSNYVESKDGGDESWCVEVFVDPSLRHEE